MKYRVCSPATGSALACGANNAKIATGANISQVEVERATTKCFHPNKSHL